MTQRTLAQRARRIVSEEDDIVPGTSRDANRVEKFAGSRVDERELQQDVLQYLLAGTTTRGFVREADLRRCFGANCSKETRDAVMKTVGERFEDIIGLKLYYDKENQRYYLGSELRNVNVVVKTLGNTDQLSDEAFKDGLLISALMFIFMAKRHVIKDEPGVKIDILREFLSTIHVIPNDVFAKYFGPTRSAEFPSQGWLNISTKREANGEETILYDWGSRAETVVNKRKLLEQFCELNNSQLCDWPRHASEASIRVMI